MYTPDRTPSPDRATGNYRKWAAGAIGAALIPAVVGCGPRGAVEQEPSATPTAELEQEYTVGDFVFIGERPGAGAAKYIEDTSPDSIQATSTDLSGKSLAKRFKLATADLGGPADSRPTDTALAAIAGTVNSVRLWEAPRLAALHSDTPTKAARTQQAAAEAICIARRDKVLPGSLELLATEEYRRHIAAFATTGDTEPLRTTIRLEASDVAANGFGITATPTIQFDTPTGTIEVTPTIDIDTSTAPDGTIQVIAWKETA